MLVSHHQIYCPAKFANFLPKITFKPFINERSRSSSSSSGNDDDGGKEEEEEADRIVLGYFTVIIA
jgi:hypothetical protein